MFSRSHQPLLKWRYREGRWQLWMEASEGKDQPHDLSCTKQFLDTTLWSKSLTWFFSNSASGVAETIGTQGAALLWIRPLFHLSQCCPHWLAVGFRQGVFHGFTWRGLRLKQVLCHRAIASIGLISMGLLNRLAATSAPYHAGQSQQSLRWNSALTDSFINTGFPDTYGQAICTFSPESLKLKPTPFSMRAALLMRNAS